MSTEQKAPRAEDGYPELTPGAGDTGGKPERKEVKSMLHFEFSNDPANNERVRAVRDKYRAALTELMRVYHLTREYGYTPADCARRLFAEYDRTAVDVLSTLVNSAAWDGRISPANAAWAASRPGTLDEKTALLLSIFNDELHRAHLDQIATECRKLESVGA